MEVQGLRLTEFDGDWHIITAINVTGDTGHRVDTACGIKDRPWDQTFVDQMPSGGAAGACAKCRKKTGR